VGETSRFDKKQSGKKGKLAPKKDAKLAKNVAGGVSTPVGKKVFGKNWEMEKKKAHF